jgi:transposase InsO family protein
MPWKEVTAMSHRRELVFLAEQGEVSVAELARRFGVSRKTIYKWLARARADPAESFANRSRRPHTMPTRIAPDMETAILVFADTHPTWGGKKLHYGMRQQGIAEVPTPRTITRILRRHDRHPVHPDTPRPALQRFVAAAPNVLWQMDYKGWEHLRTGRVYPLTVLDDHSRFLLALQAAADQRWWTVQAVLTACFERYGLPWDILADNGPPWGAPGEDAPTRLELWLMQLGVTLIHGRPFHPQTQGKVERLHRTLKADVFAGPAYRDLVDAQRACDDFRTIYNHDRPHEGLQQQVPGAVYRLSPRPFPPRIEPPTYADEADIRRVSANGTIRYRGFTLRVSHALTGQDVGVYPTARDGVVEIHYYRTVLRRYTLRDLPPDR